MICNYLAIGRNHPVIDSAGCSHNLPNPLHERLAAAQIAAEVAALCAARGDRLWLIGRDPAKLQALTASLEIGANHPQITYYFLVAMAAAGLGTAPAMAGNIIQELREGDQVSAYEGEVTEYMPGKLLGTLLRPQALARFLFGRVSPSSSPRPAGA